MKNTKITNASWLTKEILMILTIICVGIQLFVNPYIGLANNGDFQRMSLKVGLDYFGNPWSAENYNNCFWNYMITSFKFVPRMETGFDSSSIPIYKIAIILHKLFAYDLNTFDIRWIGLVYFIPYALSIVLAFKLLKNANWIYNFIGGLLLFFFFTDVTHIVFFNTFYSEAMSFISIVLFFVLTINFIECNKIKLKIIIYMCEVISACFFLTAKYQNFLAIIGLMFILNLQGYYILKSLKLPIGFYKKIIFSIILICLNLIVSVPTILFNLAPNGSNTIATANVICKDILSVSKNPEKMLTAAGFTQEQILYIKPHIGYNVFEIKPTGKLQSILNDSTLINRKTELKMLISEPLSIFRLIKLKAQSLFKFPEYGTIHIGNNKPPMFFDKRFSVYSRFTQLIMQSNWLFYIGSVIIIASYASWHIIRFRSSCTFFRYHLLLALCIISAALAATVVVGDSSHDSVKHFYIANETFYFAFYYAIWDLLTQKYIKIKEILQLNKRKVLSE